MSRRIASAAFNVAIGGTFWTTLWKTYLRMIVRGFAPSARAASTYDSSLSAITWLRTTRKYRGT